MDDTISQQPSEKTMRELDAAEKPQGNSRSWTDPEGYKYLVPWSNACAFTIFIRRFTESLPKSEYRENLKSMMPPEASFGILRKDLRERLQVSIFNL